MDPRGFSVDPNNLSIGNLEWWQQIGPTKRPAPYATASWVYLQDYSILEETIEVPAGAFAVYDEGSNIQQNLWNLVWDGGEDFSDYNAGVYLNSAQFNSTSRIVIETYKLARVTVYDSKASSYGLQQLIQIDRGDLVIDGASEETRLAIEGDPYDGDYLNIVSEAALTDDVPPGTLLGQLNYQLLGSVVTITDWSHYNWDDDTPVRKAFSAMVNSLPECVEEITVEDSPLAFWTSLGFMQPVKGSPLLTYSVK